MSNEQREVPACAAIQLADGALIAGKRHDECIKNAVKLNVSRIEIGLAVQGFMTTHGRFVDRKVGYELALVAGIVDHRRHQGAATILFSEDLY